METKGEERKKSLEERFKLKKKKKWRGHIRRESEGEVRREEAEKEGWVRREWKSERMDKEKSQEHSNNRAG